MIGNITTEQLTEILKSDSVYTALRHAYKNPTKSGVDECDDDNYIDLYNLVLEIRAIKNQHLKE